MKVYLVADATEDYESCAFAYQVGNFPIHKEEHLGWMVVEGYLHGLLAASNFIIQRDLIRNVGNFSICTPSKMVVNLVTTDRLDVLHANNWKDPEGKPVFYVPQLKELYFHRQYYKERNVNWDALTEVDELEYKSFLNCQEAVKTLLSNPGIG